jgi:choline dehydrogenase-like flavoprotein
LRSVARAPYSRAIRISAPIEAAPRPSDQRRQGDRFLPRPAFKALAALAEVVVDPERVRPDEVAGNVDRYMGTFRAQRKWVVKVALLGLWLYPLRFLKPTFPRIKREARREFVEKRFIRDIAYGRVHFARRLIQAMFRLSSQMAYLGYYGDPRTFDSVGYKPFTERDRFDEELRQVPKSLPRLECIEHAALDGETVEADAVVVGSGAAGAIVAYRLAEAGRRVLVLERGLHLHPSEFEEDEVKQISNLYADGALQLTRDFGFQVLQGMCVGGSTVVNNAVCFDLPDHVRDDWNGPKHEAGLDKARLAESHANVRRWLGVAKPPSPHLQQGAYKFVDGVKALELNDEVDVVATNISNCPGSGYCNIGCPYGKKLSMLDKVLPEGQERFGAENLRILPECRAERIETRNGRAEAVRARLSDGRRLRVKANTVVVSAGAIASSWLLMESGIAKSRAGRDVCFNMGSPITADFDDVLDSFDGVQISHYLRPEAGSGFVMESWFNPVVSQALNMPGWLDDHRENMRRFRHLTAAGVLVGTKGTARLRSALTGGVDIVYTPAREDVETLVNALKLLCRIYLRAGARRVMPSTFGFHAFTDESQLDLLDEYVKKTHYLSIGSGHPQGGNALSGDPGKGVVDPTFRVHGFENLFVCDASVFPTATTVNPQLTVMALAEYAAPGMAEAR